jgi:hypothetical protein
MSEYDPNRPPQPQGDAGQDYPGMAPPPPSTPAPTAPAAPPQPVRTAVNLLFALIVIGVIGAIIGLTQTGSVADQIRASNPAFSDAQIDSAVTVGVVFGAIVSLIFAAVFLWLTFMVRKGANWARTVLTVLFVLGIIFQLIGLAGPATALAKVVSVIQIALEAAILYLLWQRPSTEYFTAQRARY